MSTSQLLLIPKEKRLKCKPEVPLITQKAYFDLVKFFNLSSNIVVSLP